MTTIYALAFCVMLGGDWSCLPAEPADSLAGCNRMLAGIPEGDRPYTVNGGWFKWSCAMKRIPAWELTR